MNKWSTGTPKEEGDYIIVVPEVSVYQGQNSFSYMIFSTQYKPLDKKDYFEYSDRFGNHRVSCNTVLWMYVENPLYQLKSLTGF